MDEIVIVRDLLQRSECEDLIRVAETRGFKRARFAKLGRVNDEIFIRDAGIAERIKSRLVRHCPIVELDDLLEIYRYTAGDEVTLHRDAHRRIRHGFESNATVLVYLSDSFSGGQTFFPELQKSITPFLGMAVLFVHHLLHASQVVTVGTKYVVRVDTFVNLGVL